MKIFSLLKTYTIVFVIIFVGGTIWSMINGYSYFCEGLKSCDKFGVVLSWEEFTRRQTFSVLFALAVSAFITFMLFKNKGGGKGGA